MDYQASLVYLDSLGLELRPGAKFELAQVEKLLAALGHPERRFASVHVAGTNGKGSTAALIEAAARVAGWRTGLYTSPHLERVTERIRLPDGEIQPDTFAAAATRVRAAVEDLLRRGDLPHPPSFFEVVTAIGFLALSEAGVELAVVEVGLGGRLDATNVLAPLVAVITPIGMDHENYLGDTLEAIAAEKAGIIKPGLRAVVSAPQPPSVAAVLRDRCRATGVPLIEVVSQPALPFALPVRLRGRYQADNALCAFFACRQLSAAGFAISDDALRRGFEAVDWPGRLERVAEDPEVYLDGAHNPMAAEALAEFMAELPQAPVLVFGCMRDKNAEAMAAALFPRARAVVLTVPRNNPRACSPAELQARCGGAAASVLEQAESVPLALARAYELADGKAPIVVAGSLYLVGEIRAYMAEQHAKAAV